MNIRAKATFKAGSFARLEAKIVPKLMAAVGNGTKAVLEVSQALVPVDTGDLKASGRAETEWKGKQVKGTVSYNEPYAAYVEFGTGARGAASEGAGPYVYDRAWPGMPAQPYLRPALDTARLQIKAAFAEQGFTI